MAPDGPRYEAEAIRCHACEARDRKADVWRKDTNADPSGILFAVHEID